MVFAWIPSAEIYAKKIGLAESAILRKGETQVGDVWRGILDGRRRALIKQGIGSQPDAKIEDRLVIEMTNAGVHGAGGDQSDSRQVELFIPIP